MSIENLCQKYGGALPRYTSYPTAVEFQQLGDPQLVADAYRNVSDRVLSLYVHVPYCKALCYFCACNKVISEDPADRDRFLDLLTRESELIENIAAHKLSLGQVHLGGGSPSYLNPDQTERLLSLIERSFEIKQGCEKSVELDPRTFDVERAEVYRRYGFNRASLGVQDFDADVQKVVNRVQSRELVFEMFNLLRESGFDSINADMIYGLPGQTEESFASTIDTLCELKPDTIALYGYAHVTWKNKVQKVFNKHHIPEPRERIRLFEIALNRLIDAGYVYLGLDHFTLPDDPLTQAYNQGRLRRNFMGYTTVQGEGVLGIGPSSISDLAGSMFQNATDIKEYEELLNQNRLPVKRYLKRTLDDRVRAAAIESVMCNGRVKLSDLIALDKELAHKVFNQALPLLSEQLADELVEISADQITVTPAGRPFLRSIASSFDTYLAAHKAKQGPVFSQAV